MKILPNLITAVRFALTPVIVLAILHGEWNMAFWISIAAGITDVLDGLAARSLHVSSRIGSYLDPIADKLLLTLIYLAFGIALAIPWWMVALVFGRDLFIVAMAAYGFFFTTVRDFPPTVWGKFSTFVQIIAALAVMNNRGGSSIPAGPFLWTMVATTAWSGIHYGWRGLKMLHAARAAVPS
ncbi:MAG: CDP-alcohol phosphatidyltransferase family protein [Bryobacteraceae bacterium]